MKFLTIICALALHLPAYAQPRETNGGSGLAPIDSAFLQILGIEDGVRSNKNSLSRCSGEEKAEWLPNTCSLASYIKSNVQSLESFDVARINTNIVYFGETHISQSAKRLMNLFLPRLKSQGFNVLAMEMFNANQQPILDEYFEGTIDLAKVEASLKSTWGYESAGYVEMIQTAKNNGIRVLALDHRESIPDSPFIDNIKMRDEKMVDRIIEEWNKDPKEKIIVYVGSLHAQTGLSVKKEILSQSEVLKNRTGVSATCFTIRERMRTKDPVSEIYFQQGKIEPAFLILNPETSFSHGYFLLPQNY